MRRSLAVSAASLAALCFGLPSAAAQVPGGAGVEVIDGPIDCPAPFSCRAIDLRIDVRPDEAGMQGLEVRFLVPAGASDRRAGGHQRDLAPVLLTFPGTGYCWTRDPLTPPGGGGKTFWDDLEADPDSGAGKRIGLTGDGIVQVMVAIRGHRSCYQPGDGMFGTGSWIGPVEFADYDALLERLAAGDLHAEIPAIDPRRVGLSGGSHGGITSLIYAARSSFSKPFALVMPAVGSPDMSDWVARSLDPTEGLDGASGIGLLSIPGVISQLKAYPGSDLQDRMTEATSGDFSRWAAYWGYRTAYDGDGGLDTFDAKVRALVMHTGGRDCIVPVNRQVELWEQLQRDYRRPNDLWLFSTDPHSCNQVTARYPSVDEAFGYDGGGGFFPTWSEELEAWSENVLKTQVFRWAARTYLAGRDDGWRPGPALVTPLVQGEESGHREPYRAVRTLDDARTGRRTLWLRGGGALGSRRDAFTETVIEHEPGQVCPVFSVIAPCGRSGWGGQQAGQRIRELERIRSSTDFVSRPFRRQMTLLGSPSLRARVRIDRDGSSVGAGIVAQLWYLPPDLPAGSPGWMFTHGMRFLKVLPEDGVVDVQIPLDSRVITLERGGRLRLALTNLTTYVKGFPWHHPVTTPYDVTLLSRPRHPAKLELPVSTSFEKLPLADLSGFGESGGCASGGPCRCRGMAATQPWSDRGDVLRGTPGRDVIVAGPGSDTVRGRGGGDLICGGSGRDTIRGQGGADQIRGNGGRDRLRGGAGSDRCRGGAGRDRVSGCRV
ncbi:MAG: hypothetical protein KJ006_09615 [Thermoleophilia bacterium]|nr:hypothetical protein [Thermoleophilia bacterium]